MLSEQKIWLAQSDKNLFLLPQMANRHGLIAGATGTGKTVTMKVMAESFSDMGVPVFLADIKGDLSGMCRPGRDTEDMQRRIERFGLEDCFQYKAYPTRFWDIFGEMGHPVRVTVSEMGPTLLGRLLGLTEIQTGVLNIVFRVADDNGLLLLDLKDLRAMLQYVGENRAEYTTLYGNVSAASVGAIQRALLAFESEGGELFFGEPGLDIRDWMRTDFDGRGYINVLTSTRLIQSPLVYSTFLLWMLTELYEKLPEVGDLDKPRMVFFFDEAHLLFKDANRALVMKLEQIIKLIRSKGVGVYFISQSPSDIPDAVLAQLSNRVQHALRAYTPAEMKSVRAAAKAFRVNEAFDSETVLMELGVGEALVSFLDEYGVPSIVERAKILPPQSLMGAAEESVVKGIIAADEFEMKYRQSVDRESAYEVLVRANMELERLRQEEAEAAAAAKEAAREAAAAEKAAAKEAAAAQKAAEREAAAAEKAAAKEAAAAEKAAAKEAAKKKKVFQQAAQNAASSVASSVTTNVVNAVTGGKTASAGTIAKRAATNALRSVMRSGATGIIRGLFGNKK
ncbi:MAG: helicase HerA-like domain-containing protein [Clostridia bacterium]